MEKNVEKRKRLFDVSATVTISISTQVEAETAEEAKTIAEDREMPSLCYQCSRGNRRRQWAPGGGEFDGSPMDLRVTPAEER